MSPPREPKGNYPERQGGRSPLQDLSQDLQQPLDGQGCTPLVVVVDVPTRSIWAALLAKGSGARQDSIYGFLEFLDAEGLSEKGQVVLLQIRFVLSTRAPGAEQKAALQMQVVLDGTTVELDSIHPLQLDIRDHTSVKVLLESLQRLTAF